MTGASPRQGGKLPPAAASALLTLRLRAALQEAEAAEAEEAAFLAENPHDGGPSIEAAVAERRAGFAAELQQARDTASRRLDEARREAERIRSEAQARADELVRQRNAPPPPPAPVVTVDPTPSVVIEPTPSASLEPDPWVEFARPGTMAPPEVAMAVEAAVAQSIVVDRWADVPASRAADGNPAVVTVDAEAFARVFATVLATVLDERIAAWRSGMVGPLAPQALVAPEAEKKPSLLRRVFHVDVVLTALAAAIVLVLLFAWLG